MQQGRCGPYLHDQEILLAHHEQVGKFQMPRFLGHCPQAAVWVDEVVHPSDNAVVPASSLLHKSVWCRLHIIVKVCILQYTMVGFSEKQELESIPYYLHAWESACKSQPLLRTLILHKAYRHVSSLLVGCHSI